MEEGGSRENEVKAWLAIAVAVAAVYANSLKGVFLFDDLPGLLENTSIRTLSTSLREVYSSRPGITLSGRPFAQFTFGLDYAIHGLSALGCRLVNVTIHSAAAILMFEVVKRALERTPKRDSARFVAFAGALIWALHPMQTESVTYIVQRVESLAGLAVMASLYCLLRDSEGPGHPWWSVGAVCACLMGVLSKESAGIIPPLAIAFDAIFIAGTVKGALKVRRWLYGGLFATWIPLGALVYFSRGRGGSVGAAVKIGAWDYFVTQLQSIVRYIGVALWPTRQSFDFGITPAGPITNVIPQMLLLLLLSAVTLYLLWKRPKIGFIGLWFFLTLAPSSSFIPINQTMAEHRFYLPLASLAVLAALLGDALQGQTGNLRCRAIAAVALVAVGLGFATIMRNRDYMSAESMWRATVRNDPGNVRARINYANVLVESLSVDTVAAGVAGRPRQETLTLAALNIEEAMRLDPQNANAIAANGNLLEEAGRADDAMAQYERALEIQPDNLAANNNLGVLLCRRGEYEKGIARFERVLYLKPDYPSVAENLARARAELAKRTTIPQKNYY